MSDTMQSAQQTETKQEIKKQYSAPVLVQHDTVAKLTQTSTVGPDDDLFLLIS